jgi:hypothetical protein
MHHLEIRQPRVPLQRRHLRRRPLGSLREKPSMSSESSSGPTSVLSSGPSLWPPASSSISKALSSSQYVVTLDAAVLVAFERV